MRRLLALAAVAAVVVGCTPPVTPEPQIIYVTVPADPAPEDPPAEPAAPETPAAPTWQPSPWHVYELDATDAVVVDYDAAGSVYEYHRLVSVVPMDVELHNRDNPDDPWHMEAGGMQ